MSRFTFHLAAAVLFVSSLFFAGHDRALSSAPEAQKRPAAFDAVSYRSRTATHKVIVAEHETALRDRILAEGGTLIADYGAFALLSAPRQTAELAAAQSAGGAAVRDDLNVIHLRAGAFDTTAEEPRALAMFGDAEAADRQLYLVQMVGPVKDEWFEELRASADILAYIPNNAYLVRAESWAIEVLSKRTPASGGFVQYAGAYRPGYKIAPELLRGDDEEVTVTVQVVGGEAAEAGALRAASEAQLLADPTRLGDATNLRLKVPRAQLAELARRADVVWIEPWSEPELLDERQNLIISGNFSGNQLFAPGYLAWLQSKGLASAPDFLVDIADSGIDRGLLDPEVLHPDFLNTAGLSRVVYAHSIFGSEVEPEANDLTGHGTLNAGIVGGYNVGKGFPNTDSEGYSFGLGVHPFVRMGVTRLFAPQFTSPNVIGMLDLMYRNGARISSNSWGSYNNNYTTDAQIYDSLVRDAQRGVPGNQEMTIIFASGNNGAGGNLASPATGKNLITVGASENLRPTGLDGCGVGPEGANEALSMISFSSGGPSSDGRIKPDIVAPGTHVQGPVSRDPNFTGSGVCGPRNFPSGQTLYTWSSGTSHATPAVAGAAALVRQFFQKSTGRPASPAMIKAFLTNSTTYMTGFNANDALPGPNQGWGLLNIGRALDEASRILIDQERVLGQSGQTFSVEGRVVDATRPLRVTLAWTDAPGSPVGNPSVNDLDLVVEIGGKTYLGNRFSRDQSIEGGTADRRNNIESVWLPAGTTGDFTVRVVAANIAGDGVPGSGDATDQDFALVVYNAREQGDSGGGPVDGPPAMQLNHPMGGERLLVGDLIRILWTASDDKGIQSQRVEFSSDGGQTFNLIATLDGQARHFDWRIPPLPTARGRIKVTALDGVNLPVSSVSPGDFEVTAGPPDMQPPQVLLMAPNGGATVGGGLTTTIRWKETDNVGVIQRIIEFSADGGKTFQQIIALTAPSSGAEQSYEWQVPGALQTAQGRVRLTVVDGAGNRAEVTSQGKIAVWPLPIITDAAVTTRKDGSLQLEVFGRNFRKDSTQIWVDGKKLKKLVFNEKCDDQTGVCKKVSSNDGKLKKRLPEGKFVNLTVRLTKTDQVSPPYQFKRKKPKQTQ